MTLLEQKQIRLQLQFLQKHRSFLLNPERPQQAQNRVRLQKHRQNLQMMLY